MDVEAPIRERTPNARQARSQSLMGIQASSRFLQTMVNLPDQARKKEAPEENGCHADRGLGIAITRR